jgi:hypothetical protein
VGASYHLISGLFLSIGENLKLGHYPQMNADDADSDLRYQRSSAALWIVLRQRLDDEVEPEPQTPTVMIEKHRKNQRHHEEDDQHTTVLRPNNE